MIIKTQVLSQVYPKQNADEIRSSLQKSKADTNRIDLLFELGRTYLAKQIPYGDTQTLALDTAIMIFNDAISLSDSLHVNNFKYESMLMLGETYLLQGNKAEGEKRFLDVASIYQSAKDLEREARTWLRLGRKLTRQTNNYADILRCFEKSIQLYHQAGNIEREAAAKIQLADLYYVTGRLNMAEKESLEALELYQSIGYKKLYNTYYLLSVITRYKADFDKSLLYATKCVQNAKETKDTNSIDFFYGELALIYDELGQLDESIHWYRITLEKRKAIQTVPVVIFRTAGLLARQLIKKKKEREALALMFNIANEYSPQTSLEKATVDQYKAYCFDALNQFDNAEKYYLEMLKNYEKTDINEESIAIGNTDIGRFYLKYRQFEKARSYLIKALSTRGVLLPSSRMDVLLLLFRTDSAMERYSLAVNDLQQYQLLKDSIFNEKKSKQIEELQIQYETERKEKEISLLNNRNKAQEVRLQNTAMVRNFIVLGILILLGFLYYRYRLKQKSNRQLEEQQRVINQKNISLENLVKEKEWLVKEIHHRVKNNFHIVMGLLGTQTEYLKTEEAIQAIGESQHRIQAMSLIHQKLYQSDNLSAINMSEYIHELVNSLRESFTIRQSIQFKFDVDKIELDLSHCIPLGLIMNEAITNSIKYAFPDNKEKIISISFKHVLKHQLLLTIGDNGIGLPSEFNIKKLDSMGMKLMQGLSDDIDAEFSASTYNGTEIRLAFIYDPEITNGIAKIKTESTHSI
jgi:two-component sensor histidine kinase